MYSEIEVKYSDIVEPKSQLHAAHPCMNKMNHDKLMEYLLPRINQGATVRDNSLGRMAAVDKDVIGWLRLSDDDRERARVKATTGNPIPTLMNLPLIFIQLDDRLTYFAQTFAPGRGMFYQSGKPDEVDAAQMIVSLMNNHAIYGGYYRQVCLTLSSCLKYNLGGMYAYWDIESGPKLSVDSGGNTQSEDVQIWAGNKVESLDMYNTFIDPMVHPTMVYKDGEWGARVKLRSRHWVAKRIESGLFVGAQDSLRKEYATCKWYRHAPKEADLDSDQSTGTNWIAKLSDNPEQFRSNSHEILDIDIRLRPSEFGLLNGEELKQPNARIRSEIWQITILNGERIIRCERKNNVHNHIPYYLGLINDDNMGRSQKSDAELLSPLQTFASFLINAHVKGTRKKIQGLTVYDSTVVDLSKIPEGEVSAQIPVEAGGIGKDLNKAIWESSGNFDTSTTINDLDSVYTLMQNFFPSNAPVSQVADIDRATNNQVAAVQQGSNRRNHKAATLLDSTLFTPLRFGLYFNILQYQKDGEDVTDFRGRPMTINLETLRATDLLFIIGMGLKSLDRQAMADKLQMIIFALIQNPNSAARTDVLGLIDYWTDMLDIDLDMKQFEIQPPAPAEGAQGGAQGVGTGVVPATNPEAITEPLFKA